MRSNPAIDPVPFGHWTLRDKAAQRRSSPRWAFQFMNPHFRFAIAATCMFLVLPSFAAQECVQCSDTFRTCLARAEGATHSIQACQASESEVQESRLNEAYKAAQSRLTSERRKELQDAQRRWLAYRSAGSGFYLHTGLSGYKIRSTDYWLNLTVKRVQELNELDY
jgi:uncharacterized protein YecT (DUF1311 family)